MRLVADGGGRLAPAARRGLAHLARLAGAFPHRPGRRRNARPAGPPAPCPGRCAAGPGRHDPRDSSVRNRPHRSRTPRHRGRTRHRPGPGAPSSSPSPTPAGPTTNSTSPQQLLTGLDLRATTLTTRTAALVRDAGTNRDVEDRARLPRTDIDVAGLTSADTALDLALCFHHAVQDNRPALATTIARLRERTHTGDYAYYADITHYMAGLPLPAPSPPNGSTESRKPAPAGAPWSPPAAPTSAPDTEGRSPRIRSRPHLNVLVWSLGGVGDPLSTLQALPCG